MAVPTTSPVPMSPQTVGNAFVEQYYNVFHMSPEHVHRFYLDSSILSRPDANGAMTSATTMQGIKDLVLSLDSKSYIPEIETIDSQASYKDGVMILVTGCLIGKEEKIRRRFTHSFFLAPQAKGAYFVLNDVFRYVDETQPKDVGEVLVNGLNENVPKEPLDAHINDLVQNQHDLTSTTPPAEGENDGEAHNLSETGGSVVDEEVIVEQPSDQIQADAPPASEVTTVTQEDLPKKSYASIVKVMKGSASPVPVYVPTMKSKPAAPKPEKPSVAATKSNAPPESPAENRNNASEVNFSPAENRNNASEVNFSQDVEGYSIYIRNLPLNATAEQLIEEFKKFGAIKPNGVQVRSHKIDRFCFGFVEFEALDSMQAAIKASPITIGGRQVYIEEKRTTTRVVNGVVMNGNGGGRGRYTSGRGGYRNDNFRGRGGFGGNQGYSRGEFRNRIEYSNRGEYPRHGRGGAGREGYQPRGVQNSNGRMPPHPNGLNENAAFSA